MPSPTLEAEPTETNIRVPSLENTTSRVEWPPPGSFGTITSGLPLGLQVAGAIGKAHDRIRVADIDPLRICRPDRKRCRTAAAARWQRLRLLAALAPFSAGRNTRMRPAPVSATKMSPFGRDPHLAGIGQAAGELFDLEARRHLELRVRGLGDHAHAVAGRTGHERPGEQRPR